MTPLQQKLQDLYLSLSNESLVSLTEIYSEQIEFVDPVGSHRGITQLKSYFANLLSNCITCRFDIHSQDQAEQKLFIRWTMHYAHPMLSSGKLLSLDGISELHIEDGLVSFQRDYYDLGAMMYEHVPLLGRVIRRLKQRLSS
ncbi:nuclear transport factor 2 family protein [Bowmanella sp. Y26]|uniref:nuclear transport factor 2 family protein n=1 Tax=Bowmanella yangjiangensis TaxID=2811230 RepID=UPI001BDC4606|nr:nuclear transport factor 2 family protein [Bowmanella yangjiangensis]MBT1064994.1 nuclear transport factor 2 family protein [Bowmanella yangjiangensis]